MQQTASARDRLLLAAAELMQSGGEVSTRAICAAAGVTAPTLYHHFGSKQAIVDAVVHFGFSQYAQPESVVAGRRGRGGGDAAAALRDGWDRHVQFGLEHPAFYALLYGRVRAGQPCAITAPATEMLTKLLESVAREGLLALPPGPAAAQILAANVGVTLALIAQPEDERDMRLSIRVREAAFFGVFAAGVLESSDVAGRRGVAGPATRTQPVVASRATAAIALAATLDSDSGDLTPGELGLLRELLARLSGD